MLVQITTVPDQPNTTHRGCGPTLAAAIENMRRDPPHGLTSAGALAAARSLLTRMTPADMVELVRAVRDSGLVADGVGPHLVSDPIPFEIAAPGVTDVPFIVDGKGNVLADDDEDDEPGEQDATPLEPVQVVYERLDGGHGAPAPHLRGPRRED